MKEYIDKSQWTSLPGDLRFKLRQVFGISLTESSVVVDDRVISDGVSDASIRVAFSVDKMKAWLGKEGECDELWKETVERVRAGEKPFLDAHLDSTASDSVPQALITTEPTPAKVDKPKTKRKKK